MLGEIYLCRFPFTDGIRAKIRPALELFDMEQDTIICRITSQPQNERTDLSIREWAAAGLLKPSIVRLGRIITADKHIIIKKLGVLSHRDLEGVRSCWNEHMRL